MFWSKKTDKLVQSEHLTLEGQPSVSVLLRPSSRARRLSLRVSKLDGRVTLTVPHGASRREAETFARDRAAWIREHLLNTLPELRPTLGDSIPFQGKLHPLVGDDRRAARIVDGRILLPHGDPNQIGVRLEALLKREARDRLAAASDHYAERVGRSFGRISLRDTRSRWGSCSSQGNLMYSWRLVMAPATVLDYVAAHEVAHLVHMDHSPRFWAQVEAICPHNRAPRAWLRANGTELHRYRFRS